MDLSMEKGLFSVLAVFWEQGQSVHHDNFYPCLLNDAAGKFIGVFAFMYDADDACIDEHFGADDAGLKCDVYGAAFCADADFCRLYDGVLFSCLWPEGMPRRSRSQPPISVQWRRPEGAPL